MIRQPVSSSIEKKKIIASRDAPDQHKRTAIVDFKQRRWRSCAKNDIFKVSRTSARCKRASVGRRQQNSDTGTLDNTHERRQITTKRQNQWLCIELGNKRRSTGWRQTAKVGILARNQKKIASSQQVARVEY